MLYVSAILILQCKSVHSGKTNWFSKNKAYYFVNWQYQQFYNVDASSANNQMKFLDM